MSVNMEAAILSRLIEPEKADLVPEAARYMLRLDFGTADISRMNCLAAKARAGTLSAEESEELRSYNQVSHLVALLQSKARLSLKRAGSA